MKAKSGLASIAVSAAAIFIAPSSFAQSAQNANIDVAVNATITAQGGNIGMEQIQNFSFNLYAPAVTGGASCAYRLHANGPSDITEVDIYRAPFDTDQGAGCGFVEEPETASILVSCEALNWVNFSAIHTPAGSSTIHLFTSEILPVVTMNAAMSDNTGRAISAGRIAYGDTTHQNCSSQGYIRLDLGAGILVNPGAEIGAIEVGRISVEAFY